MPNILVCRGCGRSSEVNRRVTWGKRRGCCSHECAALPHILNPWFWSHVDKSAGLDECWIWTGGKDKDGYGKFAYGPHSARTHIRAHAYSFEISHGSRGGLYVLHRCDVRACCNPAHLFVGTAKENYDDARSKGRNTRGERVGSVRFTEEDVRRIRAEAANGRRGRAIAREIGCSTHAVYAVIHRETWAHIA